MSKIPHCAVSDYLHIGAENALTIRELKALLGLPGREVRRLIQVERLRGVPILSDCCNGYYLAGNDAELARFIGSMRRRAGEIMRVADAVEGKGVKA